MTGAIKHLALIALLAPACLMAQTRVTPCNAATLNNEICITGTASTTDVDGKPLTGAQTFRVEQKLGVGAFATVATGLATLQYHAKNLAPGSYVFRVYQNCAACVESFTSNTTTRDATAVPIQPNPPVIIIAATIREGQPPTYRIVYTVRPRADEYVFVMPESTRSVFAAR